MNQYPMPFVTSYITDCTTQYETTHIWLYSNKLFDMIQAFNMRLIWVQCIEYLNHYLVVLDIDSYYVQCIMTQNSIEKYYNVFYH